MTSCSGDGGGVPCAWQSRHEQAQNELLLARYEAQKWKEKYLHEKQRRRRLARSLLDTMALLEGERHAHNAGPQHANRPRRSSSTFSDIDHIDMLLSPTLSSFDFDDDDEEEESENDDGDRALTNDSDKSGGSKQNGMGCSDSIQTVIARDASVRASVARSTSQREVRPSRSSTVAGAYEVSRRRDGNVTLPPSNLLYRMLYSKPSSRDLWSAQTNKFHSVARSIIFSMQLKKEHVFEHFFIAGVSVGKEEKALANRSPGGLVGFWKPTVFYEFAQRAGRSPDPTVADFCFPVGVPVVKCKPHQASALIGAPVSIWTTDVELLQRHTLDSSTSKGYTFRLTGAKGEALYGFCVSVLKEVHVADDLEHLQSPPIEHGKRMSFPEGSQLKFSEQSSGTTKRVSKETGQGRDSSVYLAPVCYCFTSKFPFYKLHFATLRLIIETNTNDREPHRSVGHPDLYEVSLTIESDLGVEFAECRQTNTTTPPDPNDGVSSLSSPARGACLGSISSGIQKYGFNDPALSEESSSSLPPYQSVPRGHNDDGDSHSQRSMGLKKSYSSDDVNSYRSSNGFVVERPVVVRVKEALSPRLATHLQVGDILEAIDGVSTASLSFDEAMELVKNAPRPLRLRFRRLGVRKPEHVANRDSVASDGSFVTLSPPSADIVQRLRRLPIGDPGQWVPLRLPNFSINYQFPKRDADRWSVGVVLCTLSPANVVKIIGHLLLEKQVVIMGRNSAHTSAVCTALLLLLAPFQWQSTYIPQLPSNLLDFLHSPVPFLAGSQPLQSTEDWPDVCFFDIDNDVIFTPIADHHIHPKSIPYGEELIKVFEGSTKRLHRFRPTSKPWHELSDEEDKIIGLTLQEAQKFLRDLCSELTSAHVAPGENGKSFYERLQKEVATIVRKSNFEDFLEEFSQTQLFCQYCETAINAEKAEETVDTSRDETR